MCTFALKLHLFSRLDIPTLTNVVKFCKHSFILKNPFFFCFCCIVTNKYLRISQPKLLSTFALWSQPASPLHTHIYLFLLKAMRICRVLKLETDICLKKVTHARICTTHTAFCSALLKSFFCVYPTWTSGFLHFQHAWYDHIFSSS